MKLLLPRQTPWQTTTDFEPKIQAGAKIHHFVEGDNWQPGMIIHFFLCDLTKTERNQRAFRIHEAGLAEAWKVCEYLSTGVNIEEPLCFSVEDFELRISSVKDNAKEIELKIGDFYINTIEMLEVVAMGEGFASSYEFIEWFSFFLKHRATNSMKGQIVHWTDKLFNCNGARRMNDIKF